MQLSHSFLSYINSVITAPSNWGPTCEFEDRMWHGQEGPGWHGERKKGVATWVVHCQNRIQLPPTGKGQIISDYRGRKEFVMTSNSINYYQRRLILKCSSPNKLVRPLHSVHVWSLGLRSCRVTCGFLPSNCCGWRLDAGQVRPITWSLPASLTEGW